MEAACVGRYAIMSLQRTVPGRGTLAVLDTDPPLVIYMGHAGYPLADVSGQGVFLRFRSSSGGNLVRTRHEQQFDYSNSMIHFTRMVILNSRFVCCPRGTF